MSWYSRKREEAENNIKRWQQRYPGRLRLVRFLVANDLKDTRSPGKRDAYKDWLEQHTEG